MELSSIASFNTTKYIHGHASGLYIYKNYVGTLQALEAENLWLLIFYFEDCIQQKYCTLLHVEWLE